jgi:hypothetical protein
VTSEDSLASSDYEIVDAHHLKFLKGAFPREEHRHSDSRKVKIEVSCTDNSGNTSHRDTHVNLIGRLRHPFGWE